MRIRLLSVGRRMPAWVDQGFAEYAKRLPRDCALELIEIEPANRGRSRLSEADIGRLRDIEGERLLKALPAQDQVIALDVGGRSWSTEQLAEQLEHWRAAGRDLSLLVGGPDGLSAACLARAEQRWSLSSLTYPHPLVRVILAEQLYRAWSLTQGHPYHRGG